MFKSVFPHPTGSSFSSWRGAASPFRSSYSGRQFGDLRQAEAHAGSSWMNTTGRRLELLEPQTSVQALRAGRTKPQILDWVSSESRLKGFHLQATLRFLAPINILDGENSARRGRISIFRMLTVEKILEYQAYTYTFWGLLEFHTHRHSSCRRA